MSLQRRATCVHEVGHAVARVRIYKRTGAIEVITPDHGNALRDPAIYLTDLDDEPKMLRELVCIITGPMSEQRWLRAQGVTDVRAAWLGDLRQARAILKFCNGSAPELWREARRRTASMRVEGRTWKTILDLADVLSALPLPARLSGHVVTSVIREALAR